MALAKSKTIGLPPDEKNGVKIYNRFSRSRQLGHRVPAFRLGVPPRYNVNFVLIYLNR